MPPKTPEPVIEKALITCAALGPRAAGRELGIDHSTIVGWKRRFPERYAEIKAELAPKWRAQAAAEFEEIADRLTALEHKAVDELEQKIPDLEGRDLANALRNITTSKGINTDQVNKLRGQPDQIVEHRLSVPAIEEGLKRMGLLADTTAEPEPQDAQLVPELPPAAPAG